MMNRFRLFLLLFLMNFYAFGQNDVMDTVRIGEIVVTTQRIPQEEFLVPYSISLLGKKEMDHFTKRTAPEMLMNMDGVFVQKTNHGGGSPFIRGLTGNQTLLLIDGIRLNNSIYRYGPNQYLNTIDIFTIDRMEVAKGTGSVQYGSDAIGGALQLFTADPLLTTGKQEWHGSATGKFMTGGMEKTGRGQLQYNSEKVAFLGGGTYRNFGDLVGGKETGVQSPSGYTEYAFDGKLLFAFDENVQLTLASQFLNQSHVPIYHKVVLENYATNEFQPQQRLLNYAKLNLRGSKKAFDQVKFIASWQQNTENTTTQKNNTNMVQIDDNQVNTFGFVTDITSEFSKIWTANSGIEYYHDKVSSSRFVNSTDNSVPSAEKRGLYPDGSQYGNFALYSLHHFTLNNWVLDGGLRFNAFNIKLKDDDLGVVNISPDALVFNVGAMYNLNRKNHLYATISNGFRAPNIDDMGTLGIVDFRYEVPAYDLKPEKSINYEIGYKLSLQKFQANFAAYYLDLNQLIARTKVEGDSIEGYPVYKKENVGEAYITGAEADFLWKVSSYFDLNGSISYTYGQNVTNDEPLRRIPPFNGKLAATYSLYKFFVSGEFLFAAKQDRLAAGDISDNRIPDGGTPGWEVVNIFAGYQLAFVKMKVGFENLLNEDYRTHGSGINGVGRSAWVMLDFEF
ncbi:MAG TPA: TonB-dependent receptor [Draconibacterium sp.]|nr:TonB-dependent receptor [Draconibacterium sp.]